MENLSPALLSTLERIAEHPGVKEKTQAIFAHLIEAYGGENEMEAFEEGDLEDQIQAAFLSFASKQERLPTYLNYLSVIDELITIINGESPLTMLTGPVKEKMDILNNEVYRRAYLSTLAKVKGLNLLPSFAWGDVNDLLLEDLPCFSLEQERYLHLLQTAAQVIPDDQAHANFRILITSAPLLLAKLVQSPAYRRQVYAITEKFLCYAPEKLQKPVALGTLAAIRLSMLKEMISRGIPYSILKSIGKSLADDAKGRLQLFLDSAAEAALEECSHRVTEIDYTLRQAQRYFLPHLEVLKEPRHRETLCELLKEVKELTANNFCSQMDMVHTLAREIPPYLPLLSKAENKRAYLRFLQLAGSLYESEGGPVASSFAHGSSFSVERGMEEFSRMYLVAFKGAYLPPNSLTKAQILAVEGLKYLETLGPRRSEEYVSYLQDKLPSISLDDFQIWLQLGRETALKWGNKAGKYYHYPFKKGTIDSKINEFAALRLLNQSSAPSKLLLNSQRIHYHSSSQQRLEALEELKQLLVIMYRIKTIKTGELREAWKAPEDAIKRSAPKFASIIDDLFKFNYDPIQETTFPHEHALHQLEQERIHFFETGGRKVSLFLDQYLTLDVAEGLMGEMIHLVERLGNFYRLQGTAQDYFRNLKLRLNPTLVYNKLRMERNQCYLDDLVDRTATCITSTGKYREAPLIYALDREKASGREVGNLTLLSINAYRGRKYLETVGKVLLVHTLDQEQASPGYIERYVRSWQNGRKQDPQRVLLVDGVIIGPDLRYAFAKENPNLPFDWKSFTLLGILNYAQQEGYRRIVLNRSHGPLSQTPKEFTDYVLNLIKTNLKVSWDDGSVKYIATVSYSHKKGTYTFRPEENQELVVSPPLCSYYLPTDSGPREAPAASSSSEPFAYTHHLEKKKMDARIIKAIRNSSNNPWWDGETYLESFFSWHEHLGQAEPMWNAGKGYVRGIELRLRK